MRRIMLPAAALLLAPSLLPTQAHAAAPAPAAEETPDLVVGGEINAKLQSDFTSINRTRTRINVFTDAELKLWANYKEWLSVNAQIKLERTHGTNINSYYRPRTPAFRSETLTLRQLYATLRPVEGVEVSVGKFHTLFGAAYERTPGQFYSFASDYEQDERIGVRLQAKAPRPGASARLTAAHRGLHARHLGLLRHPPARPPSATPPPTASGATPAAPSAPPTPARWRAGPRPSRANTRTASPGNSPPPRQATSDPTARAEEGISFSAGWDPDKGIALTPHLSAAPFAEYARFNNALTIRGLTRQYLLGGVAFVTGKWELDVAAGIRKSTGAAAAPTTTRASP
jgi:hypothetical protein